MSKYYFSAAANEFIPLDLEQQYRDAGTFPDDSELIADEISEEFLQPAPEGKIRVVDENGMPAWGDIPPPTHDEEIANAEAQKQMLIDQANEYMNSKQWPGKASLGRLSNDEVAQYNAWLDYLDELEAVDTSKAPDIIWPYKPE